MLTMTLNEAKARLNSLVEKACKGEQIVLLKGSKIVATILPLSEADLEISSRLTDRQAQAFWDDVDTTDSTSFSTPEKAVGHLKKHSK